MSRSTAARKALIHEWSSASAKTASAPAAAAPAESAQTADEAFTTRVKTLEEQVVDLKEKIFRTKARLLLLQETVLGGDLSSGARAVGTWDANADLVLKTPVDVAPGSYSATLTLTLWEDAF